VLFYSNCSPAKDTGSCVVLKSDVNHDVCMCHLYTFPRFRRSRINRFSWNKLRQTVHLNPLGDINSTWHNQNGEIQLCFCEKQKNIFSPFKNNIIIWIYNNIIHYVNCQSVYQLCNYWIRFTHFWVVEFFFFLMILYETHLDNNI